MSSILIAVFTAVVVLLAGNVPWAGFGRMSGLGARNLLVWTAVPWAILPMSLYLWAYWRFIGGTWGPSSNRDARRANLRANSLSTRMWSASLAAGVLGFAATLALLAVAARLVQLPSSVPIVTPPEMPLLTAFLLLAMQSIVAGVSEEAAFRGYMQSIIERQYGAVVAILLNGVLFGLLHFGNHPADVFLMLPYYVLVSAVYGGLTWAANSILPAVVLHCVGDIIVLTRWWATGIPEWQVSAAPQPLVWEHGVDSSFVVTVVASLALVVLTALAYQAVHKRRAQTLAAGGAVLEA